MHTVELKNTNLRNEAHKSSVGTFYGMFLSYILELLLLSKSYFSQLSFSLSVNNYSMFLPLVKLNL